MHVDRDGMWQVLDSERTRLADLLTSLSTREWAQPSLCTGWTVRDVAAHLTLAPQLSVPRAFVELVRARGSFDRMVDGTARRHASRPAEALVEELRGIVGSRRLAPGQKLADALMDVLVHGQDIAVALGRRHPMPLEAARASAAHLWRIGFPFHARKKLRGFRLSATDVDWAGGAGAEIRGPIEAILPLLAGRMAALPPAHRRRRRATDRPASHRQHGLRPRTRRSAMTWSIHHTEPGTGTRLDTFDAVHTVKVGAEHTDGAYELFEVEALRAPAVPPYRTPWAKSYYILDGRLTVHVDAATYDLGPGSTVTIPPGTAHTFAVTTPSARFLAFTTTGRAGRLFADIVASVPRDLPMPEAMPALLAVAQRNEVTFA